jgi:HYR domain
MTRFTVAVAAALVLAAPASAMRLDGTAGHTITVPGDIGPIQATGALTDVAYSVSVTPADEDVSCDAASPFPVGTTQVHCTAVDADPQSFTVTVEDTIAPDLAVPGNMTVEATSSTGADVSYSVSATDAVGVTSLGCDHDPGHFDFGTTTVTCTARDGAGNSTQKSFTVTVQDTTAPAISGHGPVNDTTESPSGKVVNYDPPTATDLGQPVNVTCQPASGSSFPVGTTAVTCAANDGRGNSTQTTFNVNLTLVDTTAPVLSGVPSGITEDTESPAGAIVSFPSNPSATDNVDGAVAVSCTKHSGDLFPVGTTHVTCTATDAHTNSASAGFDVTVNLVDHTKPVLSGVPGAINDTTESPSGKSVTFAPSANDNLDGVLPVTCTPASGSTFPVGTTSVTCSATDSHGNAQQATFTVTLTLIDITAPVLTGVSPDRSVEANGPAGSIVTFATPTATDNLDGPLALVNCSPASGTLFSLGPHTVTCSASDAHSNVGSASFRLNVVDTTPPTIAVPGATNVYATTPTGIPETAPAFQGFRAAASADDIVDPHPYITDNLGDFAELGPHTVNFIAHDASGNAQGKSTQLTVLPMPPAGTQPLPMPPPAKLPPDVTRLQVVTGSGFVRLTWAAVSGAVQYLVYRSQGVALNLADGHGDLVYNGTKTTYTDRGLKNGVEYRYVVVSQDAAGNRSSGVAAVAMPRLNLLRSPKDGARLKAPPKLVWARNAEASYYNVQLYRGQEKILSSWPLAAALKLKRTWKYEGKRYALAKGVYRWYVWPGFGARAAVDYGELLGSNSFSMIR